VTPDEDARRFAAETRAVFAPLANRLGIWQLKWELEDAAFRVLEPETYDELRRKLAESRRARQAFVDEVAAVLRQRLQQESIRATVKGRPKHIYSIYQKMRNKRSALTRSMTSAPCG
jgi:GTP pyrophosphokinase